MRLLFAALAAAILATFVSPATSADICSQGAKQGGHLAYKLCVWKDAGPATKLVWDRNESRGEVRRELYASGTLYSECVSIEVGLRNIDLSKGMTVVRSVAGGKTETVSFSPSSAKNADVVVDVCGGEGTLWVPNVVLQADHYVQMRSIKGPPLAYNHPEMSFFTKSGEDVRAAGEPRYAATRLNTKVP